MKRTIGQTLLAVEQNLSSVFTKEDVVELLRNIEEEAELSDDKKEEIIDEIMQSIESDEDNIIDKDSIRLSIDSSNYISAERFDVDFGLIRTAVRGVIENL